MILSGLASVAFRHLSPLEIIDFVVQSGLSAIEWGGDIHVPHGQIETAQQIREATVNAGLKVSSYGSYYRVGASCSEESSFSSVLDTAMALNAPVIRIWAGDAGSNQLDADSRNTIITETRRIATIAKSEGMDLAYEFHSGTLIDNAESARKVMQELNCGNVYLYWQPAIGMTELQNAQELSSLLPWVKNIHVFHWWPEYERHLLAEGRDRWESYIDILKADSRQFHALIEFVKDDEVANLFKDAEILTHLL